MAITWVTGKELAKRLDIDQALVTREKNKKLAGCWSKSGKNKNKYNLEKSIKAYKGQQKIERIKASEKSKITQRREKIEDDVILEDDVIDLSEMDDNSLEKLAEMIKANKLNQKQLILVSNAAKTLESIEKALEQRIKRQEKSGDLIDRRSGYKAYEEIAITVKKMVLNSIGRIGSSSKSIEVELKRYIDKFQLDEKVKLKLEQEINKISIEIENIARSEIEKALRSASVEIAKIEQVLEK